ncbi:hypothetical protein ANCDUO_17118 [Ancylostoma duodenale]|uniref:G-protein coupled receptors family 1 profile domain-containing protein n=1 Tax=Ancylostoma duodenale TaxID=51022 RepID=A0A0C2G1G0_9BILA|nr:hypothetical protein ANCDUO_17118 [Ancylostoma duodenale]
MGLAPLLLVIAQILFFRRCFTPVRFLVLSKLVADGLEMFVVMMLLVASQLIFEDWIAPKYQPTIGYLALALQYSSFYSSIAMTVNRLLAVLYPLRYNSWFNNRTTIIMVVVCWLFAWIHNLIYLRPECSFTFDPMIEQFVFSTEPCGETLSLYQDLTYNVVLAILSTTVDIFSLVRLRTMSRRTIHIPDGSKREKPWFLQATINSCLYVLMLGSFHIAECFTGITLQFLPTVIAWQIWLSSAP